MAKKHLPDAAMPLGDKRSSGMGAGVDTGAEHGPMAIYPPFPTLGSKFFLGPNRPAQIEPRPNTNRFPRPNGR